MPSLLARLIHDARAFLTDLSENNTKDWWEAHRDTYEDRLKQPAQELLEDFSRPLARMSGSAIKTKLFRPHRDLRFSKDKTPYHTHLHLLWQPVGDGPCAPAYFFGVSPNYITFGAGQTYFDKTAMAAWRATVVTDGSHIATLMDALSTSGYRISEPAYKRVPAPYAPDHAAAPLLRRKGLSAWRDHDASLTRDQMLQGFESLTPLVSTLAAIKPEFETGKS